MKIDRRSFLALGMGTTVGMTFTPLPWKLTDDLSIWTQNWSWTPVPEDGDATYDHSVCTLCPGGCGIMVRKINNRIVKIDGLPAHPVNRGGLCALGLSGPQLLYGPDRVKGPMKRAGKRGEGKWTPLSWDEAIAEVVDRLKSLAADGRTEALACVCDTDRGTVPQLFRRLLALFGSPNVMTTPSMYDSYAILIRTMQGISGSVDIGFDVEHADFILSFGSGIIEGWGSPVRMMRANSQWKKTNVQTIQVEQRLSNTAAAANGLFAVKAGSEADLALGLAAVIIKEKRYDAGITETLSTNFSEFSALVLNDYTPDAVAEKTGVAPDHIVRLARDFSRKGSKPLAICGRGKGETAGGMREFMAVHCLNALMGRINAPGGVWNVAFPDYIDWAEDPAVVDALKGKQRVDGAGSEAYPDTRSLLSRLPDILLESKEAPVQVLFVSEANPCYTLSGTKRVREAFEKIPMIVSFSSRMDETADLADLILPDHSYLERYQDVPVRAGLTRPLIGLTRPMVQPVYDTMHTGDVILKIAAGLGGAVAAGFEWKNYQDCLKKTLGSRWDMMNRTGFWTDEAAQPKAFHESSAFAFPSRLPPQIGLHGDPNTYPLILMPKVSMRLSGGHVGGTPFTVKTVPDTELKGQQLVVEINPRTGQDQGLADGKQAILETPVNRVTVRVSFFNGMMPGLIAMPRGLGHTAYSAYLKDKGASYNALVGPVRDPLSGQDASWGIRARLTRA